MSSILIVDDETNMRRILSVLLAKEGHSVAEAAGAKEALRLVNSTSFDVVFTDQKMADGDGLSVIAACREADQTLPVVLVTAFATVALAVEAMRQGAFDFISKPFVPEVVLAAARRAADHAALLRENMLLKGEVRRLGDFDEIIGESAAMLEVKRLISRVAPTDATVLIVGETGTGKELVARSVHKNSGRAGGPFVAINCAALPETLLESELFGHERGAFTGADRSRQGLFEAAHRGTLLLDEGGEMSLALQAKLLRVLTDGKIIRVGATTPRSVDVRIIVATHRDLQKRVREGKFREDLYYRLAVVPLHVPPLRQRPTDIPLLVEHLSRQVVRDLKVPLLKVEPEAIEKLLTYDFPGNVRELRNLIERAFILATGNTVGPEDFPMQTGEVCSYLCRLEGCLERLPLTLDLRETMEWVERGLVKRALGAAQGVQAEAARHLGISRSDMAYKVRKYGLDQAVV
jgi:DNA-binding NtrC family response regulator